MSIFPNPTVRAAALLLPLLLATHAPHAIGATRTTAQHPATADKPAQDEAAIGIVEAEICRAFQQGDARTLRSLLVPTFTLTSSTGVVTDLAQNLKEVETREPAYEVFRNHDQVVRRYGDAAVVTGITTIKGRAEGTPFAADFQFTDTYVKQGGRWRLAASHASRLPAR